jgi:hypothetical protein
MVSEDEWSAIRSHFTIDAEIVVTRNKPGCPAGLLSSAPSVCDECLRRRQDDEEKEKLIYSRVPVYIRDEIHQC